MVCASCAPTSVSSPVSAPAATASAPEPSSSQASPDASTVAAFFQALDDGQRDVAVRMLSDHPALAEASDPKGRSAFVAALFQQQGEGFLPPARNEALSALLRLHPRLDPLEAAAAGDLAAVQAELARDPSFVARVHKLGWTPLHFAAFGGQPAIAEILIARGAAIDAVAKNHFANTPLLVAMLCGQSEVARTLLAHHADVNARMSEGFTALHEAAQNGDLASVKLLLEAGADPAIAAGPKKRTALDVASENGHLDVVALLRLAAVGATVRSP